MFQLIKQDNVVERNYQESKGEGIYYACTPGQFKDKEAIYEEDISTDCYV